MFSGIFSALSLISAHSQTTGNYLFNDNNRFKNNWSYQQLSNSTTVTKPAFNFTGNEFNLNNSLVTQSSANAISINVLYNAQPTSYMAIFHINQAADSVRLADRLVNERYKRFVTSCEKLGIAQKDIFMDMIALVPIYEREKSKKKFGKNNNEKPIGVEIQKNIHIKYTKAALLDQIFTAAAESEIYDLIKVEYFTDSTDKIMEIMNNKALGLYNKKIDYFKKLGVNLDTCFKQISESKNAFFPIDEYTAYKPLAVSRLDFKTNDEDLTKSVNYPESTTVFYNQLVQKGYDAIINPNTNGEPKIQYVYNLTIQYTRNLPVVYKNVNNKNRTFVLSPTGTLVEVPQSN